MKKVLELLTYQEEKMAFLLVDNKIVFSGNFHDFHIGCYGPTIAGINLASLWDEGMLSLQTAMAYHYVTHGFDVELSSRELTAQEYLSYS